MTIDGIVRKDVEAETIIQKYVYSDQIIYKVMNTG